MVGDLARAAAFLTAALGAREVYRSGETRYSLAPEAFFEVGGLWLCLMEGPPPREEDYRHLAFQVEAGSLPRWRARLDQAGARVKPGRPRVQGEGESLYFYDLDGNLFELHDGSLAGRLAAYQPGNPIPT